MSTDLAQTKTIVYADDPPPSKADLLALGKEIGVDLDDLLPHGTKPKAAEREMAMVRLRQALAENPDLTDKTSFFISPCRRPKEKGLRERSEVDIDKVRPNSINSTIFGNSLSAQGLQDLVEDVQERDVVSPIEVTAEQPDPECPGEVVHVILNGERRWRSAKAAGKSRIEVIIVHGVTTDEEIEDYIVRSYTTARGDGTVGERVALYKLLLRHLKERYGRGAGRPKNLPNSGQVSWTPKRIKKEAARLARLGSPTKADYAVRIFEEGDADLQAAVNTGETSISAAYEELTKQVGQATSDDGTDAEQSDEKAATGEQARQQTTEAQPAGRSDGAPDQGNEAGQKSEPPEPASEASDEGADADTEVDVSTETAPSGDEQRTQTSTAPADGQGSGGQTEATSSEAPTEKATASGSDPTEILKQAAAVMKRCAPDKARKVLHHFASKASLEVWIGEDDPMRNLETLRAHVRENLGRLAAQEFDAAQSWVWDLQELVGKVLDRHLPAEEKPR